MNNLFSRFDRRYIAVALIVAGAAMTFWQAWAGAIVLGGVTLKSHALLSAGSVAGKSLKAWTIYRGNPAEPVRERTMTDEGGSLQRLTQAE